jgi:hypothetical protein
MSNAFMARALRALVQAKGFQQAAKRTTGALVDLYLLAGRAVVLTLGKLLLHHFKLQLKQSGTTKDCALSFAQRVSTAEYELLRYWEL